MLWTRFDQELSTPDLPESHLYIWPSGLVTVYEHRMRVADFHYASTAVEFVSNTRWL